jgi:malonate transporter
MVDVLNGFLVVVVIIALGYAVGRRQLLGTGAVYTLNMFVFFLATPALLINFLREADLGAIFGENLAVVAISSSSRRPASAISGTTSWRDATSRTV